MYCRLLIVDDDPGVLNALRRELMREPFIGTDGLEVETFSEPAKALSRIVEADGDFDVVVADYRMPQMDGITFLDLIRARRPLSIRILLTGMIDQGGALAAVNEARVHHLISKPWHEYDLKGRIALALHERQIAKTRNTDWSATKMPKGPFRLLLVDDDPFALKALTRDISLHGRATRGNDPLFDITVAMSGAEAIEQLAGGCPDVVISDFSMVGMDGVELLYQFRERCPDCVRILISGRDDLDILQQAINVAGVFHFIGKPWEAVEIHKVIAEALAYRQATIS